MVQTLQGSNVDERVAYLQALIKRTKPAAYERFETKLDMSWIYHDSALEGVVYTPQELSEALGGITPEDPALIPTYDEIRQHQRSIELIRDLAKKKRSIITLDLIKKVYSVLVPEEAEGKGGPKYRKDIPIQRMYFHDIAPPDKITYKLRQLTQWVNAAETKRSTHIMRIAAKFHHQFLHIYPYPKQSGKVARLLMNMLLLQHGYPAVIIHSTERQRYFEAIKGNENVSAAIVNEAMVGSVESAIRYLEAEEEHGHTRVAV